MGTGLDSGLDYRIINLFNQGSLSHNYDKKLQRLHYDKTRKLPAECNSVHKAVTKQALAPARARSGAQADGTCGPQAARDQNS